ncbi:hypothetical protein AB205_0032100 [Aquarana catesbeiana]|uniref:Uncharacterized protein n=1 Tax=Aquarana catesbeiana TaxID=8400 RepID=A0A2G9SH56_AQUCT|nr:hypothetical protein AB205_0032100 [Aquarana catesbeiana]
MAEHGWVWLIMAEYCRVSPSMIGYGWVTLSIAAYGWSIAGHCRALGMAEHGWMDGWMSLCSAAGTTHPAHSATAIHPSPSPLTSYRSVHRGEEKNRRHEMTPVCLHVIAPSFDRAITW